MFDVISEKLFASGLPIRNWPVEKRTLYLTFDDGPDVEFTPQILQVLKDEGVQATFFVIGDKAHAHAEIISTLLADGHRLGNHSPDHTYGAFFSDAKTVREWVQRGEAQLKKLSGSASVGFRPPNGVVTPTLLLVLEELGQPLILWNCRFFDTLGEWREEKALRALRKLKTGDIILLHDRQKVQRRPVFLQTLKKFIGEGKAQGWKFAALPVDIHKNSFTGGSRV